MGTKVFSTVVIVSWAVTLGCGGKTDEPSASDDQPAGVAAAEGAEDDVLVDAEPTAPVVESSDTHEPETVVEPQPVTEGGGGAGGAPADSSPPVVEMPTPCSGRATSVMSVTANLDASAKAINTAAVVGPPRIAANPFNPQDPANTANFSTTATIYDSLGLEHWMEILFRKSDTEARTWHYHLLLPGADVVGGIPDGNFDAGGGTLRFASDGALSSNSGSPVTIVFSNISVGQTIVVDLAGRSRISGTARGVTSVDGQSNVSGQIQDGVATSCNVTAY